MRKSIVGKKRLQQLAKKETNEISVGITYQSSSQLHEPDQLINSLSEEGIDNHEESYINSTSSSDNSIQFSDCDDESDYKNCEKVTSSSTETLESIKSWAFDYSINHSQLTGLLKILGTHDCFKTFPSDSRTLIKPVKFNAPTETVVPGEYVHFGLKTYTQQVTKLHPTLNSIPLQINIDGLQVFKSCSLSFWPILGYFGGLNFNPFVIGVYSGNKKPENVNLYLQKLVADVNAEQITTKDKFKIQCFVCDAPAKSFVKAIKGHNGYHGCDKCCAVGRSINRRMSFFEINKELRTDLQFRQQNDEDHHIGTTELTKIDGLHMINSFPIDYMHLVCLGVVKKLLKLWIKGKPKHQKLSAFQISQISARLKVFKKFTSSEFSRQPRSLEEVDKWKATELRYFLLYCGPVVLKNIITDENYNLFLSLSIAIRILCSETLHISLNNYAKSLLIYFVQAFKILYGEEQVSYNIHGLIHLAEDVKNFGVLDRFSTFKFENELGQLRKLVRTPNLPLEQLKQRLLERELKLEARNIQINGPSSQHNNGPHLEESIGNFTQYHVLITPNYTINCRLRRDTFVLIRECAVLRILNILQDNDTSEIYLVGHKYSKLDSLFSQPCSSKVLQIYRADENHYKLCQIRASEFTSFKMFYIVEMKEDEKKWVAVVPQSYFDNQTCAWPNSKNAAVVVKSGRPPKSSFPRYAARILHAYATYEEARKKIVQAELTSDLSSTEADDLPHKRTRKPQRFTSPGSDNDVEDSDDDNVLHDLRGQKPSAHSKITTEVVKTHLPEMPSLALVGHCTDDKTSDSLENADVVLENADGAILANSSSSQIVMTNLDVGELNMDQLNCASGSSSQNPSNVVGKLNR
ncbi:hypothetical protein Fcan01_15190 [Folsomia candida]|uniref:Transposase domain-containing protein n=1 Tax=Folsomia candida TaxID=158441 RepID=A0A226DXU4_FOLCA|nr:hypothetical protein Fcan01_15190 [Folsomia candida]